MRVHVEERLQLKSVPSGRQGGAKRLDHECMRVFISSAPQLEVSSSLSDLETDARCHALVHASHSFHAETRRFGARQRLTY